MNKKIKCIGYTLLSTGIVVFLYMVIVKKCVVNSKLN